MMSTSHYHKIPKWLIQRIDFVQVRARFYETLKQRIVNSNAKLYQHIHTFECQRDYDHQDDQEVNRVLMRHGELKFQNIFNCSAQNLQNIYCK